MTPSSYCGSMTIEGTAHMRRVQHTMLGFVLGTHSRQQQQLRKWGRRRAARDCSPRGRTLQKRLVFFSRKPVREIWSSRGSIFCRGPIEISQH